MIGILLAFQVGNWNDNRAKKTAEKNSYTNIKRQINDDRDLIEGTSDYNQTYLEQFRFATQLIESNDRKQIDSLGHIALNLTNYSDVNRNSNIYQTLLNNGELALLRNKTIVEKLQQLDETFAYMNRMESIHLDAIMNGVVNDLFSVMKYADGSVQMPDRLFSYQFQNHFLIMEKIMLEKADIYTRALQEIDNITQLIDTELGD